jgi:hypothetical protein
LDFEFMGGLVDRDEVRSFALTGGEEEQRVGLVECRRVPVEN